MKASQFSFSILKEYDKQLAILVFTLFLGLFSWQLYSFFYSIPPAAHGTTAPDAVQQAKVITTKSPLFTIALFGDYVPTDVNGGDIKQSMLDAEVVGIMYSANEENSQVLIRVGEEEKNYAVGDKLPGGAIIKRINQDGVIVLHNGTLESLTLPKSGLHFEKPAKPLTGDE